MRKISLFFAAVFVLLSFSACGTFEKKSQAKNLYYVGLDTISIMEEMIQSEEYCEIMGSGAQFFETAILADTNDYDSPIAVYSISMPDVNDLLEIASDHGADQWNSLSDNLKRQLQNRISFSTIISVINGQQGAQRLAFSSVYTAFDRREDIKVDDTTIYLYVFEEGIPIAVTFSEYGAVTGQFVFLEDIDTLKKARDVFEEYNCSVTKVDFD